MYWIIILSLIIAYYLWSQKRAVATRQNLQIGGNCEGTGVSGEVRDLKNVKVCTRPSAKRQDYYPRYKFWWSHVKDLCTRPPYDRIFPPFWNTDYDPNITSDEYYKRLQANRIVCG